MQICLSKQYLQPDLSTQKATFIGHQMSMTGWPKRWGFDESQKRAQSLSGLSYLSRGGEYRCHALPLKSCTHKWGPRNSGSGTCRFLWRWCESWQKNLCHSSRVFTIRLVKLYFTKKKKSLSAQFPKPCAKVSGLCQSFRRVPFMFPTVLGVKVGLGALPLLRHPGLPKPGLCACGIC